MAIATIVTEPPDVSTSSVESVAGRWKHAFPSPDLVAAAAGCFESDAGTRQGPTDRWSDGRLFVRGQHISREGPQWRIEVGPGLVRVATTDAARSERTRERLRQSALKAVDLAVVESRLPELIDDAETAALAVAALARWRMVEDGEETSAYDRLEGLEDWAHAVAGRSDEPTRLVRHWSAKSRSRMVARLAELDYGPMLERGTPAMVTVTYPGRWQLVAPDARACARHIEALKTAYAKAWGRPLDGVWKREFQRRGAPHYHFLTVPPTGRVMLRGQSVGFRDWLSITWSGIVCRGSELDAGERADHVAAGTGVDYAEGMRAKDPKRLGVYFAKHGLYEAKDYQNHAPEQWEGSVGRFWGVWKLEKATSTVLVRPEVGVGVARTMRRWQRANGYRAQGSVVRRRWNTNTGELIHARACEWPAKCDGSCRKRKSGRWVGSRMRGVRGFVIVNDGAAFASQLARYAAQLDQASSVGIQRPPTYRNGNGFVAPSSGSASTGGAGMVARP